MKHRRWKKEFSDSMEGEDFNKSEKITLIKSEETAKELDEKSLKDIQIETAKKWADRADEAYKKAIKEKSIKWLMDADEYFHEAIRERNGHKSKFLKTYQVRANLDKNVEASLKNGVLEVVVKKEKIQERLITIN
jgi:Hsp20/alpha crystallin family